MKNPFRKIGDAHMAGSRGEPTDPGYTRREAISHWLGNRGLQRMNRVNDELDQRMLAQLEQAQEHAKGYNMSAVELVKKASEIPHQRASKPGWGNGYIDENGKAFRQWSARLRYGEERDSSRPSYTPLSAPLGELFIDSSEFSHNGLRIPVDNVVIACNSEVDEDGNIGRTSTIIWVNSRAESPSTRGDDEHGARIDIDADGIIRSVGVTSDDPEGLTGYNHLADASVGLGKFLKGAISAVDDTVSAYGSIPDSVPL